MSLKQIMKTAALESKFHETVRHVVWVPDCGAEVWDNVQFKMYSELVHHEATFINGKQITAA